MKTNEGYPVQEFKIELHNLEETPLHAFVKNLVANKLNFMTPQELFYKATTWEEADKKFPIKESLSGLPEKNVIYNHLPRQSYNNKVFMERAIRLSEIVMKPDICILDADFKPHSIFEIIVTSKPKIGNLIALIEAEVNVIFIYAEDVSINLSKNFNQHELWGMQFKCFTGWSAKDSLRTKVSRAVDMLIADKFPADSHKILEKEIRKNKDVYNLNVKTPEWNWRPHTGSKKGKPTSTLNALLKYYAEKTGASTEGVHYDVNTMTVEFVVGKTWNNYPDPFHVGTVLKASQGEKTLFTNQSAAIINQTDYQNISDGEKVSFVCGTRDYGKNGRTQYYANHIAGEKIFNKVWELE
jgi:hypothetical protein